MNINVRKEGPWAPEKLDWLGSKRGFDETETITLTTSLFTATFGAQGFIPSGVCLGKVTATGQYGPYSDAASDGRQVAVGFLAHAQSLTGQGTTIGGSLLDVGKIREANLPTDHGVDAAAKVDLAAKFRFI